MKVLKVFVKIITAILSTAVAAAIFALSLGLGTLCSMDGILTKENLSSLISSVGALTSEEKAADTSAALAYRRSAESIALDNEEESGPAITQEEFEKLIDEMDFSSLDDLSDGLSTVIKDFFKGIKVEDLQTEMEKVMQDESVKSFMNEISPETLQEKLPALMKKPLFGDIVSTMAEAYLGYTAEALDPLSKPDPAKAKDAMSEALADSFRKNIGDLGVLVDRELTEEEKENLTNLTDSMAETVAQASPSPEKLVESIPAELQATLTVLLSKSTRLALGGAILVLLALISLMRWKWYRGFIWTGVPVTIAGFLFTMVGFTGMSLSDIALSMIPDMTGLPASVKDIAAPLMNAIGTVGLIMLGVGIVMIVVFGIGSALAKKKKAGKEAPKNV